jgi:predicted Zn-dependent peptidase
MDSVRSVAIGVFVSTGSINENDGDNGVSHLIEHMLFKGTKKRTAFDIADDIDVMGAQINAFTSKSTTCYYTVSTFDHTEKCMEILSDIFFESVFDEGELAKEKNVVLEEISMVEDTPDELVLETVCQGYYAGHSLARPILGSRANVSAFTPDDIRGYMRRFYTADNVIVSIAGHISAEQADKLIRRYFFERFDGAKGEKPLHKRHKASASTVVKIKDIEQANIAFAFPCYNFRHPKEMAMHAMNNIFGGGMSSRLFQKIREQMGLAYSVYSYASNYSDDGIFMIYLGANPDQAKAAADAVTDVIDEFLDKGITDREFLSGKEQLKGGLVLGSESSGAIMRANGKYLQWADCLFDFDLLLKEVETITKGDVADAAKYIFDRSAMAAAYLGRDVGEIFSRAKTRGIETP